MRVVVLGGTNGIGVMSGVVMDRRVVVCRRVSLGKRRSSEIGQARCGITECQRNARCEHAKQIEQGDQPPSFGPIPSRQAHEHAGQTNLALRFRQDAPPHLHAQYRGIVA